MRVRSGRTVTPGASMGIASQVMPRCLEGASGSVRTSSSHQSATSACEVQIFCPVTTYASPSRTALVRSEARSEPSGSLKPWHQTSSPRRTGGSQRARCAGVPSAAMVGPAWRRPTKLAPT